MKTQLELLKEVMPLTELHPEAKIHICVDSNNLNEDYGWTAHIINRVELDQWYANGEFIILGLDNIMETLDDNKEADEPDTTEDEAMAVSHDAILIYTRAGYERY